MGHSRKRNASNSSHLKILTPNFDLAQKKSTPKEFHSRKGVDFLNLSPSRAKMPGTAATNTIAAWTIIIPIN